MPAAAWRRAAAGAGHDDLQAHCRQRIADRRHTIFRFSRLLAGAVAHAPDPGPGEPKYRENSAADRALAPGGFQFRRRTLPPRLRCAADETWSKVSDETAG